MKFILCLKLSDGSEVSTAPTYRSNDLDLELDLIDASMANVERSLHKWFIPSLRSLGNGWTEFT